MADDLQSSEELAFVAEEVDRIIVVSIDACLKDEVYDERKVAHWVDAICDAILKQLSELRKPLKYIGAHVVKWPSDKHKDHNRSMHCIVTVEGLSF
ncbi:Dynein light chain-like protein, partial [Globisporangium splendens]